MKFLTLAVVRGNIARREYGALRRLNEQVALKRIEEHVVQIQSGKFCVYFIMPLTN